MRNVDDVTGFRYYYTDPTEDRMNKKPINDKNGVLANTLAPYFDKVSILPIHNQCYHMGRL